MKAIVIMILLITSCASIMKERDLENVNTDFDKLWNYSDPISTREKFQEHLEKSEDRDQDYILQLKTQLARTHSLKAEFNEAHKILDEVEKMLNEDTLIAKIRYFLERGRTYNSANEKDVAKKIFVEAFEISKNLGTDNYTIDAAHMIAIAEKNLDDKVKWTEKGIRVAEESKDESVKRWIGVFFNNSGWDLFEAKRYDEALNKFQSCEEFYKSIGNQQRQNIARWSIAKTYRFLGKVEDSLSIQEALLNEKNGKDESGYTYEELAELYFLKGEKDKARSFFAKAYEILSKDTWLQKNESERLERLKKLSN